MLGLVGARISKNSIWVARQTHLPMRLCCQGAKSGMWKGRHHGDQIASWPVVYLVANGRLSCRRKGMNWPLHVVQATAQGVWVSNIPSGATGNATSCAEHAIFLALACLKQVHAMAASVREQRIGLPTGETLFSKTALVIGYGGIAKELVPRYVCAPAMPADHRCRPDSLSLHVQQVHEGLAAILCQYIMIMNVLAPKLANCITAQILLRQGPRPEFHLPLASVFKPS